jgi:hypothetical protein
MRRKSAHKSEGRRKLDIFAAPCLIRVSADFRHASGHAESGVVTTYKEGVTGSSPVSPNPQDLYCKRYPPSFMTDLRRYGRMACFFIAFSAAGE